MHESEPQDTYDLAPVPTVAPEPPPVQAEVIDSELPCRICGYNLFSLRSDGHCPECATPISRSLMSDLLRFADPEWMRRLVMGMNWILVSVVLGVTSIGIHAIVFQGNPPPHAQAAYEVLLGAVALVGYWLVTTPETAKVGQESPVSARMLTRWGQVTVFLGAIVSAVLALVGFQLAADLIALPLGIIGIVVFFAILVYARGLARRMPDPSLEKSTTVLMWALPIGFIGAILMGFFLAIMLAMAWGGGGGGGGGTPFMLFMGGICLLGAVVLILAIFAIVLMIRYRIALARHAAMAQESWERVNLLRSGNG